jgi:hypothetical protein
MVEISLSGSGEGPGRVTSRPTLQLVLTIGAASELEQSRPESTVDAIEIEWLYGYRE